MDSALASPFCQRGTVWRGRGFGGDGREVHSAALIQSGEVKVSSRRSPGSSCQADRYLAIPVSQIARPPPKTLQLAVG